MPASKDYVAFANLGQHEINLANDKLAPENAWIKSINLGYEVYTGESTLKIDKFKVIL